MNKGFSLVELIVVIAIMAILVGVAVPTYTAYIDKANAGVEKQAVGDIVYAAKLANIEYGTSAEVTITGKTSVVLTFGGVDADVEKAMAQVKTIMADLGDTLTVDSDKNTITYTIKHLETLEDIDTSI